MSRITDVHATRQPNTPLLDPSLVARRREVARVVDDRLERGEWPVGGASARPVAPLSSFEVDDYRMMNDRFARVQGGRCGVQYAEGFRQLLGHGYPEADVLAAMLPDQVRRSSI